MISNWKIFYYFHIISNLHLPPYSFLVSQFSILFKSFPNYNFVSKYWSYVIKNMIGWCLYEMLPGKLKLRNLGQILVQLFSNPFHIKDSCIFYFFAHFAFICMCIHTHIYKSWHTNTTQSSGLRTNFHVSRPSLLNM